MTMVRCFRPRSAVLGAAVLAVLAVGCGAPSASKTASRPAPTSPPTGSAASGAPTGSAPSAAAGTQASMPWPASLHDSFHSGGSVANGPTTGATLWTRNLGAPITAGAVVAADGTIYESANDGILHALDPATGADRWTLNGGGSFANNQDLSTSAAILSDGTIVWPGPNSTLDGVSPAGKLVWQQKLAGMVLSPAVGPGDKLYVSDSVGDVAAFHATGFGADRLWSTSVGKASFGSPAVGPDGTVYATADRNLVALADAGNHAAVKWRFAAQSDIEVSASVAPDGTVILGTNDAFEYGISPAGTVAWRYPRKVFSYSTPAATADGLAYFGDNDGSVDVVQAKSGTAVGRYQATTAPLSSNGVGVWTSPLVDGRHDVYFGTASGHILGYSYTGTKLFDVATGAIVASYPAMTANGTLVIGSDNGTLYAFHG